MALTREERDQAEALGAAKAMEALLRWLKRHPNYGPVLVEQHIKDEARKARIIAEPEPAP